MRNYTPGPYKLFRMTIPGRLEIRAVADNREIAILKTHSLEEAEANGNLLAEAPELLNSLEEAVRLLTSIGQGYITKEHLDNIAAPIARAKGET